MRRIGSLNHWYDGHRRVWFATLSHPEISFGEKIPVQLFTPGSLAIGGILGGGGGANELMTGTRQWNTGIVARGRIYFAADNKVYAFRLPTATPTATQTATAIATPLRQQQQPQLPAQLPHLLPLQALPRQPPSLPLQRQPQGRSP
jgi:hypothetical protein